jgi:hypothetical protein
LQLIRSAISEAEHYARVRVAAVPDVTVVGGAAADLIHLLAELVDNATSFSPPAAPVEVRGNLVGRGLAIEIEDQGLGVQPDQLERFNEMLYNPPDFQMMALAVEPRLGLFVVARLAAKHGIRVTLTSSTAYGGTMVVVLVPTSLLVSEPQQRVVPELVASPGPGDHARSAQVLALHPPRPVAVPTPFPPVRTPASTDSGERVAREYLSADHTPSGQPYPRHQASSAPGQAPAPTYRGGAPTPGPDDRPELPQRQRMRHMSPKLMHTPDAVPQAGPRASAPVDAETARSRMSALQRGTIRGRAAEPEEPR